MLYDNRLVFSDRQSFGGAGPLGAALTASTNVLDLKQSRDLGNEADGVLYVRVQVTTAFVAGGGAPRWLFGVLFSDNADGTGFPYMPIVASSAIPELMGATDLIGCPGGYVAGQLTVGTEILLPVPPQGDATSGSGFGPRRYMTISYFEPKWFTTYFSAGAVTTHLIRQPNRSKRIYPDAAN